MTHPGNSWRSAAGFSRIQGLLRVCWLLLTLLVLVLLGFAIKQGLVLNRPAGAAASQ